MACPAPVAARGGAADRAAGRAAGRAGAPDAWVGPEEDARPSPMAVRGRAGGRAEAPDSWEDLEGFQGELAPHAAARGPSPARQDAGRSEAGRGAAGGARAPRETGAACGAACGAAGEAACGAAPPWRGGPARPRPPAAPADPDDLWLSDEDQHWHDGDWAADDFDGYESAFGDKGAREELRAARKSKFVAYGEVDPDRQLGRGHQCNLKNFNKQERALEKFDQATAPRREGEMDAQTLHSHEEEMYRQHQRHQQRAWDRKFGMFGRHKPLV